ncbi:rod shape-determining protein MreD [Sphingomonas sp. PL-96]|uniref:rod shape-determining protein MreD n=1 Tax=Sphingomonas sp. PL-96 TaxID=2887201 RepID=UPI001E43D1B8|nr:rod shape-determining protein MreD [Sphingomonas sp. PL-96]MCC2976489.1 rod shape-determining protein MreD [Sphingomonas sp. PL-96]
MSALVPIELAAPEPPYRHWRPAVAMVLIGSLITILPVIAVVPFLPPFGLIALLGWRLFRSNALPAWAAAPLGLFDDLVSGQPLGSAMLLWSLCLLALDVLDTRLVQRDFWQDWLIATGAIALCLALGRVFAGALSAHVDAPLLVQVAVSGLAFPAVTRLCAWQYRRSASR